MTWPQNGEAAGAWGVEALVFKGWKYVGKKAGMKIFSWDSFC